MSWKVTVLKDLRKALETPPDTEARLEACEELLHTVEEQIDVAEMKGARRLADKLRNSLKEAA